MPNKNPFEGREQQDVIRVHMTDGATIEGSYLSQAGMHFVHVREPAPSGKVLGPLRADEIVSLEVVKPRAGRQWIHLNSRQIVT